jgi:predicted acetyltransferase
MIIRPYQPDKDFANVRRIWEEIAWIDNDVENHPRVLESFLSNSNNLVAELNGEAECLVSACEGTIRHLEHTVPMQMISAVTTSMVARKQKLASRTTAQAIAEGAEAGLPISALGMFEQGYYTRLGFGNGSYEKTAQFNPAMLNIDTALPVPVRLDEKDFNDMHQAMLNRWRSHGSVQVLSAGHLHAELLWTEKPLGLGFRNDQGELTHFIWGSNKGEHGPFKISTMAYQNRQQLLELLALIKSLGNQLYVVHLTETQHIQLQDLLQEPFRSFNKTQGGKFQEEIKAEAWWQLRINDLKSCLASTRIPGRIEFSFNLTVAEPITQFLDKNRSWQGIGGDYTIRLGEECEAAEGHSAGLPLLKASTSGISRLWLGAASANRLATGGEIEGEQSLLDALDQTLSLPHPHPGWEF